MYLEKPDAPSPTFNDFGRMSFSMHYIGRSLSDIEEFVKNVVIGGDDPKKESRQHFYDKYLYPEDGLMPSEKIIQLIEDKIDGKIYWLNEFNPKLKKCLLIRANFSFFGMSFWLLAVYNLRIATCQIISTLNPVILIILGVIFLNEKYYTRYAWGVILGIVGSCIIILNENKISS